MAWLLTLSVLDKTTSPTYSIDSINSLNLVLIVSTKLANLGSHLSYKLDISVSIVFAWSTDSCIPSSNLLTSFCNC